MNAITSRAWPGKTVARAAALSLVAGATALVLGSAPARAGNEFENGFEDQLGRLAANEVFHMGRHLLHGAFAPQRIAWQADLRYRSGHLHRYDWRPQPQYYGLQRGSWRLLDHFDRRSSRNARYERIVRVSARGHVTTVYERPRRSDYCERHGRYHGHGHGVQRGYGHDSHRHGH